MTFSSFCDKLFVRAPRAGAQNGDFFMRQNRIAFVLKHVEAIESLYRPFLKPFWKEWGNRIGQGRFTMRLLIVEDDEKLRELMKYHLLEQGYQTDDCADGEDGLHWARQQAYDLIILDRMLPGLDGLDMLGAMRREEIMTPVLMVTALGGVADRVDGLDAGADDYLAKPFAVEELLARVRAMCRRPRRLEVSRRLSCGDLTFDCARKELKSRRGCCSLSRHEADLLETFLRNEGMTLTREVLLARVWGPDAGVEEGNLDSYIHFLRAHMRAAGTRAKIVTARGVGYRLEAGGN